jgi:hypothetical protein
VFTGEKIVGWGWGVAVFSATAAMGCRVDISTCATIPVGDGRALHVRALSTAEQTTYHVSVRKYDSGDMLCKLEDCGLLAVTELKQLTEVKTGLDPELTVQFHAEYGELKGGVRLSDVVGLHPAANRSASYRAAPHEVASGHFNTTYAALASARFGGYSGSERVLPDLRLLWPPTAAHAGKPQP